MIDWDDWHSGAYLTGISEIDEQHQGLFQLCIQLNKEVAEGGMS